MVRSRTPRSRTPRRPLIARFVRFGMGLVVAVAFVPSDAGAAVRAGDGAARDSDTLLIGMPDFTFIDPALAPDPTYASSRLPTAEWGIADATCALLLRYPIGAPTDKPDYTLVPEAATSYPKLSDNGKTYTFTIKRGFRFNTGASVTAANYATAINRVLNSAMDSPGARYLQEVVSVKAQGDRLTVRLSKRVPDFPARTTMPYFCPVPTDLDVAPEGAPAPLAGSGPYYVAEFIRGSRVVLKQNPYYRRARAHHVDRIVFLVDAPTTITRKVEADELDVDLGVALAILAEVGDKYGVNKKQFWSVPSPSMFYVFMNTERPLFRNNPELRRAVNFALDRTEMLRAAGGRYFGSRTDSYLPSGLPGYLGVHPYPVKYPNLARALALARGHTGNRKAVYYACNDALFGCLKEAGLVRYALKQIGIDVEIKPFPNAVVDQKIRTRGEPWDLTDWRHVVPWVDPSQYVNKLLDGRTIHPTENANLSYFNSPRYNRRIDQAGSLSGRARYDAYGRLAVEIAKDAAPMAAYIYRNNRFLVSSRVGCVRVAAHGLDIAGVCLS
jgi:peptide/nickel transport system substrate-binding protein